MYNDMDNLVKLKDLEECTEPNGKSLVILFNNETSVRTSISLETLNELFNTNKSLVIKYGQSIYLQGNSSVSIRYYGGSSTIVNNAVTNVITYPYSETRQSYDIYNSYLNINFQSSLLKDCFVSVENGEPLSFFIENGGVSNLIVQNCPSLRAIYINVENGLNCNMLNLIPLTNFNTLKCTKNNNLIKYLVGYNKDKNKIFVIYKAKNFVIYNIKTSDVTSLIENESRFSQLTKFYFTGYQNESFSESELALAQTKNIELINV